MGNKLSTLIVDDEPLARSLVERYAETLPYIDVVGQCGSAQDALRIIDRGGIDLVYLDIQMPGMTGLALAKTFDRPLAPKFVFTTAYGEYALEGFKLDAVDYLLKPFNQDDFTRSAERAYRLIQTELKAEEASRNNIAAGALYGGQPDEFFFVKSDYKLVRVETNSVRFIEGVKDYVKIHVEGRDKPIMTLSTLKIMENRLGAKNFVRIHRSYVVNLNKVTGVERGVVMLGNVRIPIGEGYKADYQKAMADKII